VDTH